MPGNVFSRSMSMRCPTSRVREQIDNALTMAAPRWIVHTEGGLLYFD